jgi:ketosteroid isomerase-like protein
MNYASRLLFCTLFASTLTAPACAQNSDEEQTVMAVTQQGCDALRNGDLAAAEKVLAPEFTLVGSNAQIQTRDDIFAEMRAGDPQYDVFRNHSMTARVYGDAAIVQGITTVKGTSGGTAFETDVRFTDTLIKHDGQWRLVVSHATKILAP